MNPRLLAVIFLLPLTGLSGAEWESVQVPGPLSAINVRPGHFGWYRTWVKVHDSFFTKHERNLFEESVGIHIRELAGAHAVWVNGTEIGVGGAFPPAYRDGRTAIHRHKVPAGTLRKGEWNEIALRVYHPAGVASAGFRGDAPFIMNYFMECILEGPWEFRAGEDHVPGGALATQPARTSFSVFRESNRVLGRATQVHGPKLSPQESAGRMQPAADLAVDLLLHEPQIAQPFFFSYDARGRLWVTQSRQYPYPAGLTMLSRDRYYRAHYDKVPPAPPNHDRGADLVSIHESTKRDGVYDRHTVFVEGLNMASAALPGRGGVWVTHPPYLLFYPDKNGDDVPDGPPEVRLAGFGLEDTHSVANGLVWGPDGWLYGGQGSTTSSRVTRPGLDPPNAPGVYFEGCMVWRYHPDTRAYEIFAEGSGNTYGLEVDAQGRLYSGHNGGNTRGWHYVQGGFYQMQGVDPGKFGPPRNPYAFGELPMMTTKDRVVRFTHFGSFVEGTALPRHYDGLLFALDPLHNLVTTSERQRRGATFATADREPALRSTDPAFRPVYIANAPDGSLHISDMYEFYIAHGQHYQNQIDPTTGRMYRLRGTDSALEADYNLQAKTPAELVALLSHPNKWHRHTAARLLGERKDPAGAPELRKLIAQDRGVGALNALWALHQSAGLDETTALNALQHSFAPVRMWTARLLGDEWGLHRNLGTGRHARADAEGGAGTLPAALFTALVGQARRETDPEALAQFASTARRLHESQALPLVAAVLAHDEAVADAYVPLLCWWVLEAHIPAANEAVLAHFESSALWDHPMVVEHILSRLARRFAVEGKSADLLRVARLFRQAPSQRHAAQLMKGLEEGFRGRPMTGLPAELTAAIEAAGQSPLVFRIRQGDAEAIAQGLRIIQDSKAHLDDRLLYVRAFGELRVGDAVPVLLGVAAGPSRDELRQAALASLSAYEEDSIGVGVAALLPKLKGSVHVAACALLASRPAWSRQLLASVERGETPAASVPEDVANRLRQHKDASLRALAEHTLPASAPAAREFQPRIDRINGILQRGSGNPYAGEATYAARCASCHKLFFKGGNVGPDLTTYQRDNLGTMLLSIINPDAEIREGYQYYTVETKDGRSLGGFFVERDNQVTVLRGLAGENVTLRANEIKDLQPMGRSLMPAGLLDDLEDQALRDFFAYLRISQPITR